MLLDPLSAKLLLLLHAAAAIVLVGAAVHFGILSVSYLRGRYYRLDLHRTYLRIMAVAFPAAFLLGLLIYPRFRIHVRADYMDSSLPLGTWFFEVKEHWLAVTCAILVMMSMLRPHLKFQKPSSVTRLFNILGIVIAASVVLAVVVGLGLVSLRSV
ncbi:MAG TPA: hypothetical protein VEJ63_07755 [Planctomycetota bacterium]|nr:hypothetical protein [Planctomycetota bacterium]